MSAGCGSSTASSCCAARKTFLSVASACSSARVDDGRPITNGIIMCGKTTTFRKGTTGSVSYWSMRNWELAGLLNDGDRLLFRLYHLARDDALPNLLLTRQGVHQLEHDVLDDHPQPPRPDLALDLRLGNGLEGVVREAQLHVFVFEEPLILARNRVPGLRQNLDERRLVKFVQRAHDRQPADELRNQPVLDQILGLHVLDEGARLLDLALHVGLEAERLLAHAPRNLLVEADERAAADEQDVGGVDLEEFLVGVLAPTLRRDVRHRAFQDLQEGLLDALARHVARDRRVLVLAADLVDLVDVDDALLRLLDVAPGRLQQLEDDVFDVLPDVAGLRQRRRVHDREGDREEAGQGLGEERLAGAGRPNQQD